MTDTRTSKSPPPSASSSGPAYELRLLVSKQGDWRLAIWQLPAPSTPRLQSPEHVATVRGAALRIVENRVIKQLSRANIRLGSLAPGKQKRWPMDEELSLTLGLLFRTLAPMTDLDRIRPVADGIDQMSRGEPDTGWQWPCTANTHVGC